jgi:putative ABC transport system permease protein
VHGEIIKETVTPAPVGAALKGELPEVLDATRLRTGVFLKITYGNTTYKIAGFGFVDPGFSVRSNTLKMEGFGSARYRTCP